MVDEATIERILARAPSLERGRGRARRRRQRRGRPRQHHGRPVPARGGDGAARARRARTARSRRRGRGGRAAPRRPRAAHRPTRSAPRAARRAPERAAARARRGRRARRRRVKRSRRAAVLKRTVVVLAVLVPSLVGALASASRAVYFVGTDDDGLVTVYRALPYDLPAGIHLYADLLRLRRAGGRAAAARREKLLDHSLRSQRDAADLVDQLELGKSSSSRERAQPRALALIPRRCSSPRASPRSSSRTREGGSSTTDDLERVADVRR